MKTTAADYGQPEWLPEPITHYELASMLQYEADHGHERTHEPLDGGSYVPAVTYHIADQVMRQHGDDILDYLKNNGGLPVPSMHRYAWAQLPVFYLSRAVLVFARKHAALADWDNQNPINLTA